MKKQMFRMAILLSMTIVLLGALSFKTVSAQTTNGKWSVVPSPNGNGNSGLSAVAVVSATDIWAVGNVGDPVKRTNMTLIEHWNGAQWQIVPGPNPSLTQNVLYGVSAVSAHDVWAVGAYANASGYPQPLIEHWNGFQWSLVDTPSSGLSDKLFGVVAVSARNIWAVGFTTNSAFEQTTLVEHWNGAHWSVVPSPSPSTADILSSVAAVSATDVWAVGNSNNFGQPLIEHWNGANWQVVPSPSPGTGGDLRAVSAISASDAWAIGYVSNGSTIRTLVEHWNGISWQLDKSPQSGTNPNPSAVAAISTDDVWMVGSDGTSNAVFQPLIEHWNGSSWSVVPSPSPGSFSTQLLAVAAVSATDVWAVGYADGNTLIEHYQG